MEIIYFFEYRFPKPADFHFEMKQSSTGFPGRALPARPGEAGEPFPQVGAFAHTLHFGQRPAQPSFSRPQIIFHRGRCLRTRQLPGSSLLHLTPELRGVQRSHFGYSCSCELTSALFLRRSPNPPRGLRGPHLHAAARRAPQRCAPPWFGDSTLWLLCLKRGGGGGRCAPFDTAYCEH